MSPSKLHANSRLNRFAALTSDRTVFWPVGQILTRHARRLIVLGRAGRDLRSRRRRVPRPTPLGILDDRRHSKSGVPRGGNCSCPFAPSRAASTVTRRATRRRSSSRTSRKARLVRVNQATQAVEPWLAESWTTADQGRRLTLIAQARRRLFRRSPVHRRRCAVRVRVGVRREDRQRARRLAAGGRQEAAGHAPSIRTPSSITFPEPFAPGIRLLDNLPILPRHKLEGALKAGTFRKAWGLDTPPSDIVGLGPFVLSEYLPGTAPRLRAQPALLRARRRTARRCRIWIGWSSRSSPTRAPSCCGSSRDSST